MTDNGTCLILFCQKMSFESANQCNYFELSPSKKKWLIVIFVVVSQKYCLFCKLQRVEIDVMHFCSFVIGWLVSWEINRISFMVGQSDEIYVQTLSRDIISNSAMRLQIVPAVSAKGFHVWDYYSENTAFSLLNYWDAKPLSRCFYSRRIEMFKGGHV